VLVDAVAATQNGETPDANVRGDLAAFADRDILLDHGVWANAHPLAELRARADDGCPMDIHK
jgi:hypothetical protein